MQKFKSFITSPLTSLLFVYVLEISFSLYFGLYLHDFLLERYYWFRYVILGLHILTWICFGYVLLMKNIDYAYRLNWLLLLIISPTLGGLVYLIITSKKPVPKKWKRIYRQKKAYANDGLFSESPTSREVQKELNALEPNSSKTALYVSNEAQTSLVKGVKSRFYASGEESWKAIIEALKTAENYILLEFYIIEEGTVWSEVEEILLNKVKNGVEVRILYDDMGCFGKFPTATIKKLKANNINCAAFNPVKLHFDSGINYRNHRKIIVIDGKLVFTGGVNLADEYVNIDSPYGHWFDTAISFNGPIVDDAIRLFKQDWDFSTHSPLLIERFLVNHDEEEKEPGFAQLYFDSPFDNIQLGKNVLLSVLNNSSDYIYISTPYIALDDGAQEALIIAAKSGLDVRIVVPGIPDKKSVYFVTKGHFKKLLDNGIRIYTYTPGFLHAKMLLSDDKIASVGSINLDYRSFYLNFECSALVYNTESIKDIKTAFLGLFEKSVEVKHFKETFWFKVKQFFIRFIIPFC